jgi:uncharacterized membrane protein
VNAALQWLLTFIGKMFNGTDHTVETRLVCYVAVVFCDIFWLGHATWKGKSFTSEWNQNFLILAGLVALTHMNGAWAGRPANPKGGDSDDTQKEGSS